VDEEDFQLAVTEGPGFVRIGLSGPYSRRRRDRLLSRIAAECEARNLQRVLVDSTAVPVQLSTLDSYELGVEAARRFGARVRVALVAHPVTVDHFGETVARNRGANVGVFTDETAARAWLIERPVETTIR
jgi:hypothetical protein